MRTEPKPFVVKVQYPWGVPPSQHGEQLQFLLGSMFFLTPGWLCYSSPRGILCLSTAWSWEMQIPHLTSSKINQIKNQSGKISGLWGESSETPVLAFGDWSSQNLCCTEQHEWVCPALETQGRRYCTFSHCGLRARCIWAEKCKLLLNSELFLLVGIFIPFSLFLDSGSSASNRAGDSTWGSGQVCCETKKN